MSEWPPETGRYQIGDKNSCVAVCTLSSLDIELPMDSIAISGKCVTENIGVEKIIKNIISNPNIRYLLICGVEPKGHYVGQAFFCLRDNGLDENKKIIGARGAMPFIKNLSKDQLDHFNKQVELVDMIEEESPERIMDKIKELGFMTVYPMIKIIEVVVGTEIFIETVVARAGHALDGSDIPFTENARGITGLFEKHGYRRLLIGRHPVVVRRARIGLGPFAETALPASAEERATRRGAQRRSGIMIGKTSPVLCQCVQNGRFDLRFLVVAAQIAVA